MSFSKDINVAHKFLFRGNNIKVIKESELFVDLDIESLSACKTEREVLFLPLTCFEIKNKIKLIKMLQIYI